MVIPIEDEDFQTVYYFLCLKKEREKFQELIVFCHRIRECRRFFFPKIKKP